MGLFDKKYCDFCGEKIGLFGNRKLEDGNMCKKCASKLSPWFSERRHSSKDEIKAQLEWREANRARVAEFHATRTLGKYTKLLIDEGARRFMVTRSTNLEEANPDVLDFSAAAGCDLKIDEDKSEMKRRDDQGNYTSYNPPRYEYSYEFSVTIRVSCPYFDEMSFDISTGHVSTGETRMNPSAPASDWSVSPADSDIGEYNECLKIGREIKEAVEKMKSAATAAPAAGAAPAQGAAPQESAPQPQAAAAPSGACPSCGAPASPDANGCCEYCGARL